MSESEKKETIRITFPKLEIPAQVNSTGTGLINIFASDLFDFIDKGLKKTKGQNWLTELQVQNVGSEQNFRDPSVLLKELHKVNQLNQEWAWKMLPTSLRSLPLT